MKKIKRALKILGYSTLAAFIVLILFGLFTRFFVMDVYRPVPWADQHGRLDWMKILICEHKKSCDHFPETRNEFDAIHFESCDPGDGRAYKKFDEYKTDVWKRPVIFLPNPPRLVSYGSDGKPGGQGDAEDIVQELTCNPER